MRPAKPKTNAEIREWYKNELSLISTSNDKWIAEGLSGEVRARRAWKMRNDARSKARSWMNAAELALLELRDLFCYGNRGGPTFEYLVKQGEKKGLRREQIYEKIIESSSRTNPRIDGIFDN